MSEVKATSERRLRLAEANLANVDRVRVAGPAGVADWISIGD